MARPKSKMEKGIKSNKLNTPARFVSTIGASHKALGMAVTTTHTNEFTMTMQSGKYAKLFSIQVTPDLSKLDAILNSWSG